MEKLAVFSTLKEFIVELWNCTEDSTVPGWMWDSRSLRVSSQNTSRLSAKPFYRDFDQRVQCRAKFEVEFRDLEIREFTSRLQAPEKQWSLEKRGFWNILRSVTRRGNGKELSVVQRGIEEEQSLQKAERSNSSRKKGNDPKLT